MANQGLPIYESQVKVQSISVPDFQSSTEAYAESTNSLGAIGAKVAQTASNQMAAQLGGENGQTPHGDLSPSLTEFDKNFEQSYTTQAHATLGLQADKLITDSNLTVSSASRITPQLIANSQSSIGKGLQKNLCPSSWINSSTIRIYLFSSTT